MKMKKFIILFSSLFVANMSINSINITKAETNIVAEKENVFVASKISEELGKADGIKDEAYNSTHVISISNIIRSNENESPATAQMYMLWDTSYLYVYAEVVDDNYYGYDAQDNLETNDAFELMIDLYHETDYWFDGYGGEYRNEWYGAGAKMCEGMYKIAAGVEEASVDSEIQGFNYMWDDQKNNGSYYSLKTSTGYTVEYKIALGKDALEYMVSGREIGVGVKIYDRFDDTHDVSITTLEEKNDGQLSTPRSLSHVALSNGDINPSTRDKVNLQGRDKYIARRTDSYIIADGVKDLAWEEAQATDLIYVRQFGNTDIGRMTIYMLWDENYFYLFAEINDNTVNPCPSSDAFNYNNYDTVGFCLDLLRDTTVENFDTGDYKTSVGFGGEYRGEPGAMCEGFWAVTRGAKDLTIGTHWMCDDSNTKAQSSFASVSNENGYTVEMKLYAGNDKDLFMQEGRKIGVGLNVSDQFIQNGNNAQTVSHGVLDTKNFPNNDRAWGKVWAQGPSALSEVTLESYYNDESFESDGVERNTYQASRVLSDTKIKVDGEMDDVYNTTNEINVNTLVFGESNVSAKARTMWTKGYLYLFIDVKDDFLSETSVPTVSDGVIVAIDLSGQDNERNDKWGHEDYKNSEGIFVANPGRRTFGYGSGYLYERYLSRVVSNINEDGSGYTVEMRIELGENFNVENDKIKLGIAIQDNSNNVLAGIVATNTQQDKIFKYKGVLDNVNLVPNPSETKDIVNDADAMDYLPSVEEDKENNEENKDNNNTNSSVSNNNNSNSNSNSNTNTNNKNNNDTDNSLMVILIIAGSVIVVGAIGLLLIKKFKNKEVK